MILRANWRRGRNFSFNKHQIWEREGIAILKTIHLN